MGVGGMTLWVLRMIDCTIWALSFLVMHGKAWHGWVQWCFFLPFVSLLFEACCLYPYPTHSGHLAGILDIPEQVAVCFFTALQNRCFFHDFCASSFCFFL